MLAIITMSNHDDTMSANISRTGEMVSIEAVRSGVFITNKRPPESLLETGSYITAREFGQAGLDAGKSENYGQGVMRDIALQMVTIEGENLVSVNGEGGWIIRGTPEYDLYWRLFHLMCNPEEIKQGSRNRLLLGTQLVHDVWLAGEGLFPPENVPMLGKVGRRIVSMLFMEEIQARALIDNYSIEPMGTTE
jgi:hypothetical protein